jgi:hypothetical protein
MTMFPFSLSEFHEDCKLFPAATDTHTAMEELLQTLFSVRSVYPTVRGSTETWDSAVGKATGCGLDDRAVGILVQLYSSFFSSPRRAEQACHPLGT